MIPVIMRRRKAFLEVCDFGFTDLLRKHHPDEAPSPFLTIGGGCGRAEFGLAY